MESKMKLKTNIYQSIAALLDLFAGDLGYFLRHKFYVFSGAKLGKGVKIYKNVKINQPYNLQMDDNSELGIGCVISPLKKLKIGKNTMISPYCCIYDADHLRTLKDKFIVDPIRIGNNCWIGAHSIILKGVKIGDNVTIGAASVVTKDVPDNCIAMGVPARIRKRKNGTKKEN